ncbi:DUF4280 domain-containing protein [Roseomonas sp. NAR14]|uniref:DUF4280 domain-containing protein n=1 Tax=Roseomonas acroporae TaxID=2937791 RepID=A0A9X2BWX5_9PROT|nr:DUF4280 domain-containing protein [Roseomonas acroporae]MCK8784365.1 DUF4280 domain-containing protein [Roseomonas acroporae]
MAYLMTTGCPLECSFGLTPSAMIALPLPGVPTVNGLPVATILDIEIENVPPFGLCSSPANPEVIAATAAAMGVLTPMPCVPVLMPWEPPVVNALSDGQPLVSIEARALCAWAGVVSAVAPAQPIADSVP